MKLEPERTFTPAIDNATGGPWRRNCERRRDVTRGNDRAYRAGVPILGLREAGEELELCWTGNQPVFIFSTTKWQGAELQWTPHSSEPVRSRELAAGRGRSSVNLLEAILGGALRLLYALRRLRSPST